MPTSEVTPGHYLLDPYTWPWSPNGHSHYMVMNDLLSLAFSFWDTAISKFDHENPWSSPCVWSKVKVTFDLENSKFKVMAKVKPTGHIWGLESNWYVCFSFHGNQTNFGWDTANSILDLENSRSRSWPRSNPMVTFEALSPIDMFAFRFMAIRPWFNHWCGNSHFEWQTILYPLVMSHDCYGISNHQQIDCLFKSLFRLTRMTTRNLHITGLFCEESTSDWKITSERASNTEKVSMS